MRPREPLRQEDGVGLGQELQGIGEFRRRSAVLPDARIGQDVHAQDQQHLAGKACHRRHRLDHGDRVGDARRPGDDREQGFVESHLARADLEAALPGDVVQAGPEGLQDPVVGQADGQHHGHAQGDAQDGDEAPQPVPGNRPPGYQADEVKDWAHGSKCGCWASQPPSFQAFQQDGLLPVRDRSIPQMDGATSERGGLLAVGRQEDGHAALGIQGRQEFQHLSPRLGVQVPRRLIRQQDGRPVDQRPPDGHALHLAARQFVRPVVLPVKHPHLAEHLLRPLPHSLRGEARQERGQGHVLPGGHRREQVVELVHDPHPVAPELAEGAVGEPRQGAGRPPRLRPKSRDPPRR